MVSERSTLIKNDQQGGHDSRGEGGKGARGVFHWAAQGPHRLCQEQHPGSDQLQVKTRYHLSSACLDKLFPNSITAAKHPIRFRNNKKLLGRVKAFDRYASSYFKPGIYPNCPQALQHGAWGGEGDVDRVAQDRQRWELVAINLFSEANLYNFWHKPYLDRTFFLVPSFD